jgi:hypothetical protein
MVATLGDVIVVPSQPPRTNTAGQLSLQFLDGKTGALIAKRQLPGFFFGGLRATSAAGKPLVEVRYDDQDGEVNAVFDAAGQQIGSVQTPLSADTGKMNSGGLFSSGYRLLFVPDAGSSAGAVNQLGRYEVLDAADRVILTVPATVSGGSPAGSRNRVTLADGYAVVTTAQQRGISPGTVPSDIGLSDSVPTQITVYDLAAGGRKVTTLSEPTIDPAISTLPAQAVAAVDGKLLLSWMGPTQPPAQRTFHEGPYQDLFISVLDTATGRSSAPVDTGTAPSGVTMAPAIVVDQATGTVVENGLLPTPGGVGLPAPVTFAVDMARGTVSWKQSSQHGIAVVSAHGGILYAEQGTASGQPRLLEVSATTGMTVASGFTAPPLAFTADGAPVFAEPAVLPRSTASPSPSSTFRTAVLPPPTRTIVVWASAPH